VPRLFGQLNQGATIVSFQTHMNRWLICHEALFSASNVHGRDHEQLNNGGRPFVVYGMGCHMSDYAIHKESNRSFNNPPTGDCMAELMMMQSSRGAVATYGSSGYEYLSTNLNYTEIICDAFFTDPPSDTLVTTSKAQARWILGEVMTLAEVNNMIRYSAGGPGSGALGQAKRYHILGDPVLHMDAGPPRFLVTADGDTIRSGERLMTKGSSDVVNVRAVVTDEVAIEGITLDIDGEDATNQTACPSGGGYAW
jgi:hypothetical protein